MSQHLVATLAPVLDALVGLDLSDREHAEAALRERLPEPVLAPVRAALLSAHRDGGLTPKRATPTLSFGRLARPSEATRGFSVDVVDIAGPGAAHAHPRGEVSLLLPLEGAPVFEGAREGVVVLPPGSRHVPAVSGGRMLIVYFLPDGQVDWS